jgi:hypothetical protein
MSQPGPLNAETGASVLSTPHATQSVTVTPSPLTQSQGTPPSGQTWHTIWNPLKLSETAKPEAGRFLMGLFVAFCAMRHYVLPILSLLVILGQPELKRCDNCFSGFQLPVLSFFYFFLAFYVCLAFPANSIVRTLRSMPKLTGVTYFKVVLWMEHDRESLDERISTSIVQCFIASVCFVLYFFSYTIGCAPVPLGCNSAVLSNLTNFSKVCNATTDWPALPDDAPRPTSISFYILLAAFLKALLVDILFYNDTYNGMMLPKDEFVREHYPAEFEIGQEMTIRLHYENKIDKSQWGLKKWSWWTGWFTKIKCLGFQFEPNIPIKPNSWFWLFTDTSSVLKNVFIVCDRVAVHTGKSKNQPHMQMKIRDWRSNDASAQHAAIQDSSLAWGFVVLSCTWSSFLPHSRFPRHIEDMTIEDVIKVHEYLHTGLSYFITPKSNI